MASSRKKSEFLGMPFGTATHRLRKMVLFSILKRHGENICYACGNPIESVEELSMEHKEPWEGRNSDLFWDVNNIAFSHRACNRPHLIPGGSGAWRKKQGPEGTAWCARCRDFRPKNLFTAGTRWDGLYEYCNPCRKLMR
jgi:hypothetical protein